MNPAGILFVAVGLPSVVWPYRIARFEERLDGIGSTRAWDEIEPAGWKVHLTRYLGAIALGVGALMLLLG